MALSINDLKNGLTILVDGSPYMILDSQFVKPGKGAAFTRCKMRNMKTGNILEQTFRGDEKIEEAFIEESKLQYQYNSGDMFYFMDLENYDEKAISRDVLGDKVNYLKDNIEVTALSYKDDILTVNLPNFVVYRITSSEPGVKGDTAKAGTKPAKIETGAVIQVPLFVNEGDFIKVDTRTGTYLERATGA
ncbi:MAG TPA: elongation factor P [Candidatus Omnitrophota bacterium]|nr:elongation factor P [Candidatus Omnitrophota bacterium]HQJ15941.1 elongation factor P [Candidatus Omnitrophota bacterium]